MKKTIYILFLIILNNLSAQNEPQKIFLSNLSVIENFLNLKEGEFLDGKELNQSIEFLEKITEIESHREYGRDLLMTPTKKNYKSWRKWFKRHKNELYLDSVNEVRFNPIKN